MSTPGSWCDGVIVQAVADALNCKIHIIESADNFANINVIYPVSPNETTREICIGHLDEFHYVSTVKTKSYLSDLKKKQLINNKVQKMLCALLDTRQHWETLRL